MKTPIENRADDATIKPCQNTLKNESRFYHKQRITCYKFYSYICSNDGRYRAFWQRRYEKLPMFEMPEFCPQWPTKSTLADIALRALMDGKLIDHNDFINPKLAIRRS